MGVPEVFSWKMTFKKRMDGSEGVSHVVEEGRNLFWAEGTVHADAAVSAVRVCLCGPGISVEPVWPKWCGYNEGWQGIK